MVDRAIVLVVVCLLFVAAQAQAAPIKVTFQDGVSPTSGYAGTRDTFIQASAPGANQGGLDYVAVGEEPDGARYRSLLKFDLSNSIPTGATVQSATLHVYGTWMSTNDAVNISTYKVLKGWTESATWNTYDGTNAWATAGCGGATDRSLTADATTSVTAAGWYTWNLTSAMVQDWVTNPSANNGILLMTSDVTTSAKILTSREAGVETGARPYMEVTYIPEPATLVLLGVGSVLLGLRKSRNR